MSKSKIVPEATQLAAKKAFVRTAAQSLAMSLVLPASITFAFTQDALLTAAVGVGGMIVGATVNGAQAYFAMIGKGIPEEYAAAGELPQHGAPQQRGAINLGN